MDKTFKKFNHKELIKIIDDSMAKKDRDVTIFIGEHGVHITVSPITDDKPRWLIENTDHEYICSECGSMSFAPTPYCPDCGEKLAYPKEKDYENT